MDYVKENSEIWDSRAENDDKWSIPFTSEIIQKARNGEWDIILTPTKPVPHDWFPEHISSKKVLCLASAEDNKAYHAAIKVRCYSFSTNKSNGERRAVLKEKLKLRTVKEIKRLSC